MGWILTIVVFSCPISIQLDNCTIQEHYIVYGPILEKNIACVAYFRLTMQSKQMRSSCIMLDQYNDLSLDMGLLLLNHTENNGWKKIWQWNLQIQHQMSTMNKRLVMTILHGINTLRWLLIVDVLHVVERKNSNVKLYKDVT